MADYTLPVQHLAAFCRGKVGGNPAGVVFVDAWPADKAMRSLAASLAYSETAFAQIGDDVTTVRYFSPQTEVPFCGHATVALLAALGQRSGAGNYRLSTAAGPVNGVTASGADSQWSGGFVAPPASDEAATDTVLADALALFAIPASALDSTLGPRIVAAGAKHLQIGLNSREQLADMHYNLDRGQRFMQAHDFVTVNLLWRESANKIYSRNAFASGGVYEDPATGAAAAALGGYLAKRGEREPLEIWQGDDMNVPCQIDVAHTSGGIRVSGNVRNLV